MQRTRTEHATTLENLEKHTTLKNEIEELIAELVRNKIELPLRARERIATSDTLMNDERMRAGAVSVLIALKDDLLLKKRKELLEKTQA